MAVSMQDIQKLRKMTGAGMMDCKKALTEAEGDYDKAVEIIREKGQAIAAKRSDRETTNGCCLVKAENGFGAMIALKCETDFVANGAEFIKLTQEILDAAVANKCKSLDEVKALPMNGKTVQDEVIARGGVTGEKTELEGYSFIESENIYTYNHQNINVLCTMVAMNKPAETEGHALTMQVAAMNPIALDESGISEEMKANELKIAADKAREEGKPEKLIPQIAQGRMGKFYKEVCLLEQEFIQDSKKSVKQYLKDVDKDLTVTDFKRFTLRAE